MKGWSVSSKKIVLRSVNPSELRPDAEREYLCRFDDHWEACRLTSNRPNDAWAWEWGKGKYYGDCCGLEEVVEAYLLEEKLERVK